MNKPSECSTNNRRDFIKTTSSATAASVLAGVAIPRVHSAVDDTTQVALIGAGGRGTGAAANAISVPDKIARNKLVAMAEWAGEDIGPEPVGEAGDPPHI